MNDSYKWILQSVRAMAMIGLAVAGVLGLILVVLPQGLQAWELRQQAADEKVEIEKLASKVADLSDLDVAEVEDKLGVILEVLPESPDIPLAISTLKQLSEELDVHIESAEAVVRDETTPVSRVSGKTAVGLRTQLLSMTVKGDVDAVVTFIEELEKITPLFKVTGVSARVNNDGLTQAKIVIETYSMVQSKSNDSKLTGNEKFAFDAADEKLLESLRQRRSYEFNPATLTGEETRKDPFEL